MDNCSASRGGLTRAARWWPVLSAPAWCSSYSGVSFGAQLRCVCDLTNHKCRLKPQHAHPIA